MPNFLGRACTYPSCNFWHPPVCLNYESESGCKYGDKCRFAHVEAEEKPSKKSKKGGAKGSVALLKESIRWGCVSPDSHPRNLFCGKKEYCDRITPFHSPRARGTTQKTGKERVHREASFKSLNVTSAIRALPDLRTGHKTKSCTKQDAPAEKHGTWRKMSTRSNISIKATFYSPIEARAMPAPHFKISRGTRIRG